MLAENTRPSPYITSCTFCRHLCTQFDEPLSVCCVNVQSLNNKALSVADFVVTQGIDILALTETWLGTDSDPFVISESVPSVPFTFLAKKVREVVVLQLFIDPGLM